MNIDFGENIKALRLKKGLTQEAAAEFLNVAPQSVSRWENNSTYPDIEILPAIASLYGVSVDSLLGADSEKIDRRIAEYRKQHAVFERRGEREKALALSRKYYAEFPSNRFIMYDVTSDTYCTSAFRSDGPGPDRERMEEAIALAKRHYPLCEDGDDRAAYLKIIAFGYNKLGEHKKALEYADKLPCLWNCSNFVKQNILTGEDLVKFLQESIFDTVDGLFKHLSCLADINFSNEKTPFTFEERMTILQKIIDILNILFENGDMGFLHIRLADACRCLAASYANKKDVEKSLRFLGDAAGHAMAFDGLKGEHTLSALIFRGFAYNAESWSKSDPLTECGVLLDRLKQDRYDFLRDDPRFQKIAAQLESKAKDVKDAAPEN